MVVSLVAVVVDRREIIYPKPDIDGIEIPQRSWLVPHPRSVLSLVGHV